MDAFVEYIKNNIVLTSIMAAIVLLILILCIMLIVRSAKKSAAEKPETEPAVPEKEEAEPAAPEPAAPEKEEAEPATPEPAGSEKTEPKPEPEKEAPEKAKAKKAPKKPVPKAAPVKPVPKPGNASGKWVIFEEDRGGYGFKLVASNGEVMLTNSSPYVSLQSAKAGIKTYQDNIKAKRLEIIETKSGSFFVQINNAAKRLLATSSDYKTRTGCESAAESIKRWASTPIIVIEEPKQNKK